MSTLVVFIEDKIRDEQERVELDDDKPVEAIISDLVSLFELPQRDFNLEEIEYHLVRAVDETLLDEDITLAQAGVAEEELLQLVSPDGHRVWQMVQELIEKIESEIIDRVTDELKDKVTEEVWDRVTTHLEKIERIRTGGQRVKVFANRSKKSAALARWRIFSKMQSMLAKRAEPKAAASVVCLGWRLNLLR